MAEPPTDAETEALEALDYSETWLESGILDAGTSIASGSRSTRESKRPDATCGCR